MRFVNCINASKNSELREAEHGTQSKLSG